MMVAPPYDYMNASTAGVGATNAGINAPPESDNVSPSSVASLVDTYTSLIQQYLALHCLDNATFYAERLVATSKTNHSLYLLALCYYRQHQPQRTKWILQQQPSVSTYAGNTSSSSNSSSGEKSSPEVLFLLAQACHDLEDYVTAEETLLRQVRKDFRKTESNSVNHYILTTSPCPVPNGAAGLHLLAKICAKSNRKQRAIQYYKMSLQLDPFLWTSFEALCNLGVDTVEPSAIFGVTVTPQQQYQHQHQQMPLPEHNLQHAQQQQRIMHQQSTIMDQSSIMMAPQGISALGVLTPALTTPHAPSSSYENGMSGGSVLHNQSAMMTPASSSLQRTTLFGGGGDRSTNKGGGGGGGGGGIFETPNLTPIAKNEQSFAMPPPTAHRAVQRARKVAFRDYYEPSPEARTPQQQSMNLSMNLTNASGASHGKPRSLFWGGLDASAMAYDEENASVLAEQQRIPQSAHKTLFTAASETKSHIGSSSFAKQAPPTSSKKVPLQQQQQQQYQQQYQQQPDYSQQQQGDSVQTVLQMLVLLGTAQLHLGQFRSKKAIELYQQLPDEHYHTGWVLHQVGRAYFAMADYQNAIRSLQVMEQVEPHRMAGLEVLSTALWQMKREVELSHLAQRVTDFDRLSAEVWCVVGNCFSLQKEHETALTFFRRSIQLDPSFTYSHTLSGHEYFANEDFDKAVACYRDAIRADERHYNAWYGMGAVYYRQEKFDLAEYHFHRACSINPQSSVLICHLGMAQNANGKPYEALDTLQAAFRLDPHNPQAHYQRALVYQTLDRHEEALLELERVRDAAPREAQIHFSMGRLYKRMGRTEKAMRCFLDALDLDPKDTNLIKAAIEKMDEPDVEEEISAF